MTTEVEEGGDGYIDMNDRYQHLSRHNHINRDYRAQNERNVQPLKTESTVKTDNRTPCRRPRWWVWLFLVIGLVIVGVLAAVLVFILQGYPKRSTPNTLNARAPAGANCLALYTAGYITSGVHTISPDGLRQMTVYCEQNVDDGGWTVFQRRINGQVDFHRKWSEYRNGFGHVAGEHWLGNDNIHVLTAAGNQKLKIEMTHPDGTLAYADYSTFFIENEFNDYKLHVSGFIPRYPPGDSFGNHSGHAFSTWDRDNDIHTRNCASDITGGWWFTKCHPTHLNGLYNGTKWKGIIWNPWVSGHKNQSLVNVRMMVKTT